MRPGGGRHMQMDYLGKGPQKTNETLRKAAKLLIPYRKILFLAVAFSVLSTILSTAAPYLLGRVTNFIVTAMKTMAEGGTKLDIAALKTLLITLLCCYVGAAVISYVQQILLASVTQKLIYNLRRSIQNKVHTLPLRYFDSNTIGDILSRITNDVDTVASSLQQAIPNLFSALLTLLFVLVGMLMISVPLTVVGMIMIPVTALLSMGIMKFSRKYFRGQQQNLGDMGGYVEEAFTGYEVVRAYGREAEAIEKFEQINQQLFQNSKRAQFASGLVMPISAVMGNLGYIGVAVAGAMLVIRGNSGLDIGSIQTFLQYLRQFRHPLAMLSNMIGEVQSTIAAAERIFEFLEEVEEIPDPQDNQVIEHPVGQVSMEHIQFGYAPDNILINDLSIHLNSGDKVAIVGPTGAGKTTLVNLLLRFYDIRGGKILIDGVDVMQMRRNDLRTLFGMVLQDTWLFAGTIADNIRYGKLDATQEEVQKAAKNAYVDEYIRTQNGGYQMQVEEDGANLSGGQRQLITIARALLADPLILILDEATSSVDTRTEVLIQKAMERLMEKRTSFVIAHRLSTIRDAQMILVMDHGDIVETGTHMELLKKGGFYSKLYHSQLAGNTI